MEDMLLQTGLLFASMEGAPAGRGRTPGDVGNSLFRDLLKRHTQGAEEGTLLPGLFLEKLGRQSSQAEAGLGVAGLASALEGGGGGMGLLAGRLRLPASAVPRLKAFLQELGVGGKRIETWIQSSLDAQGFVRLDRLMARMQGTVGMGEKGDGILIQPRDLPKVQASLFEQGLGIGEVREAMEKSITDGGDLSLDRLCGALKKYFTDVPTPKEMHALLSSRGIEGKARIEGQGVMDRPMKEILEHFSAADSQDMQKRIKQELAHLLREKGVPPQEVKSFLEGLSVERARSMTQGPRGELKGGTSRNGAAAEILDRVVLKKETEWGKGGWQEKILDILNKERLILRPDLGRTNGQGDTPLKLNSAALLQFEGQKLQGKVLKTVSEETEFREVLPSGTGARKRTQVMEAGSAMRKAPPSGEGSTVSFTLQRGERTGAEGGVPAPSKSATPLPEPLPKVLDRMMWMVQSGEQRSRITLSPPDLGRLDLDLVIRQGHVHANLGAESLQVKELIEANLNQLRQQLSDQGLTVDKFEVMVGLDDRKNPREGAQDPRGRRGRPSKGSKGEGAAVSSVESAEKPAAGTLYQIDVHV